jgi:hypothetical protein
MNCADAAHFKFSLTRFAKQRPGHQPFPRDIPGTIEYPLDTQNIPNREDADSGRLTWCSEFDSTTDRQADN